MKITVTGGAGFLGRRLIARLLRRYPDASIVSLDMIACPVADARVTSLTGSIADPVAVAAAIPDGTALVCHLAAVLSGQSEAEFDTGLHINVDATRLILDRCRALARPPRLIFTSSLAVFGGEMPDVVPQGMATRPASSYGCGKAIGELLVSEYTRKGFIDGLVCRLPTICVRAGVPNSAASSFVSGIIREPLAGQSAACPVPLDTRLWIASPDVAVANLLHATTLDDAAVGPDRVLDLPGLTVTPAAMLDSLSRLAGADVRSHVTLTHDPKVAAIVCSWPGAFDDRRARILGFVSDADFDSVLRQFRAETEDARQPAP